MKPTKAMWNRMHDLSSALYKKRFEEKLISEQTMIEVLRPAGEMEWEEKDKYAKKLLTILKTSQTEMEILERAAQIHTTKI